ncbi:MAG TPA: GDSL-type esterase/lipase family protein [Polyangiaceae bacterium]
MNGTETPAPSPWSVFLSRPVRAALVLLALSALPELVPKLEKLRVLSAPAAETPAPARPMDGVTERVGEAEIETETANRGTPSTSEREGGDGPGRTRGPIAAAPVDDVTTPASKTSPVPLVDPNGKALERFYEKLARVQAREAGSVARITHFGDSLIASDFVSGTLRRSFQKRFGDAGHGFVLVANAWPSYFHLDVSRYATAGWKVSRIVGPYAKDGFYGLGGVSFRAEKHALARFGTAASGDFGRSVSRFVIAYAEEPRGGRFQVRVDGKDSGIVDTTGPELRARYHELVVPDGPHELELQTLSGESRLFGVVLERAVPGVVLDAIGIQGARIRFLDKQDDAHWAEQLRTRSSDLLIYQFGTNESGDGFLYPMVDYHRTMRDVIEQGQRALPESSCLVIGAMDRAVRQGESLVSVRVIPSLVDEQRKVAAEVGCAFFDTYAAMGGRGSMPNWVRRGLGQADLMHPTGAGAERISDWVFDVVMRGYAAHRAAATNAAAPRSSR